MNNKKSTILHDAIALFLISLMSILALSFVYEITKEPIEQQAMAKKLEAYKVVYPEAATLKEDTELMQKALETDLASIDITFGDCTIDEINQAYDSSDNLIGYIIKVSKRGYKDVISAVVGYSLDGTVKGMELVAINETAGLGMNAAEPDFKNQFIGKAVKKFEVTKTGAQEDNQINVISGATITTDAVVYAVNAGIGFLTEYSAELGGSANE
ncbi:MAG: FMN-binding protein [Clostridiales bacterium]|jgi:electron transport complex protein RnfG|nr:FMN-binding protein [Clostridiales bacterium]